VLAKSEANLAALLMHASPECHNAVSSDLGLIGKAIDAGIVSSRTVAANSALYIWRLFYISLGTDEFH
jgi:hypothetical protein